MQNSDVDVETLKHYLAAGHGRGYEIIAKNPAKYRKYVLEMCARDSSFDLQCEGSRAAYMYDLTMLYDDYKPFMRKVIRAFEDESIDTDWHLMNHLVDLLMLYALESKDAKAEAALFKKYDKLYEKLMTRRFSEELNDVCNCFDVLMVALVSHYDWSWAEKIAHDLGAWFIRRKTADKEALKWQFDWLYSIMRDKYSDDTIKERLQEAAKNSKEIRKFLAIMYPPIVVDPDDDDDDDCTDDSGDDMAINNKNVVTAKGIVDTFKNGGDKRALRYSQIRLSDSERVQLAESALKETDISLKANIIDCFSSRHCIWPLDAKYLIEYAEYEYVCPEDEKLDDLKWKYMTGEAAHLKDSALEALSYMTDPAIAEYAKKKLMAHEWDHYREYLEMLVINCRPEDEEFLLEELNQIRIDEDDMSEWHAIVMDITHSKNVQMPESILTWVYEKTLCSCCRKDVVSIMIVRNMFPEKFRRECMHDSDMDIRELVKNKL